MTEAQKWRAVCANDTAYDGLFFYAVRSTGIFCRPSCPSKQPRQEHVAYYPTAECAVSDGYRPCKRCRPDLLAYQPLQDIAEQAKRLCDHSYAEPTALENGLKHIGITQRRLAEIFKTRYGVTMADYLKGLRLAEAKQKLLQGKDSIAEVAYGAGFGSVPAFYRFFRQGTGQSPAAYRRRKAGNL